MASRIIYAGTRKASAPETEEKRSKSERYIWALLRLGMGWIFLWAFLDKLFGLGFETCRNPETGGIVVGCESAWINGGSPTFGFLKFGTKGPFAQFYQSLAGAVWLDWLFMLSLLLIGAALLLGIGVRLAASGGVIWLLLMYSAGFILPEHNPFLDEHILYAVVMLGLAVVRPGRWLGLAEWWSRMELVKRYPLLE